MGRDGNFVRSNLSRQTLPEKDTKHRPLFLLHSPDVLYECIYADMHALFPQVFLASRSFGFTPQLKLTFRSGMENMKHEARLVLSMVCLSFSTLVMLVLSSGTEINHRSVMTPCQREKCLNLPVQTGLVSKQSIISMTYHINVSRCKCRVNISGLHKLNAFNISMCT